MAQFVLSPADPAIEVGESVDLTVAVDTHVNRYRFRDSNTPFGAVFFVPTQPETFTGWGIVPDSPLTAIVLSSDEDSAVFRVTWPSGAGAASVEVIVSATGSRSGLITVAGTINLVDTDDADPLMGDIGGLLAAGTDYRIIGDVNLTSDLIVETLLTGIDTFELEGNGFQIVVQNGGRIRWEGVPKTGWVGGSAPGSGWGDTVSGWNTDDRLAVAPTAALVTTLQPLVTWPGSWGALSRPANSPDVTLHNSDVHQPEVANLDRSINLNGIRRMHFHDGAGVQILKHLRIVDAGTTDVLQEYPMHFHLNGETSRGSLVEGVVVEGGKNHAFVPHGSHGITFRDCVAYDTIGDVYWWDPPLLEDKDDPLGPNNSNDLVFDHCLALGTDHPTNPPRLTGFFVSAGLNNEWVNCVASAVQGGKDSSGFRWLEHFIAVFDGGNLAHNCRSHGIFTWTNSAANHIVVDFVAYHCRRRGIEHGAYVNPFIYRDVVIHMDPIVSTGPLADQTFALRQHAMSKGRGLLFENLQTNDRLNVTRHSVAPLQTMRHRNCTYTGVLYDEGGAADKPSWITYEDCGLVPADFTFLSIKTASIIEIWENGVMTERWSNGAWE